MRPEVRFEGKVESSRKPESSAFAGKGSAENRTGDERGSKITAHPHMCKYFTLKMKRNDSSASFL